MNTTVLQIIELAIIGGACGWLLVDVIRIRRKIKQELPSAAERAVLRSIANRVEIALYSIQALANVQARAYLSDDLHRPYLYLLTPEQFADFVDHWSCDPQNRDRGTERSRLCFWRIKTEEYLDLCEQRYPKGWTTDSIMGAYSAELPATAAALAVWQTEPGTGCWAAVFYVPAAPIVIAPFTKFETESAPERGTAA